MTPRQANLVAASEAVESAKARIARDIPNMEPEVALAWQRDVDALDLASKTVMAVATAPDAYADLMNLRAKSIPAFDAIVNLARQELARADAAVEERAA